MEGPQWQKLKRCSLHWPRAVQGKKAGKTDEMIDKSDLQTFPSPAEALSQLGAFRSCGLCSFFKIQSQMFLLKPSGPPWASRSCRSACPAPLLWGSVHYILIVFVRGYHA